MLSVSRSGPQRYGIAVLAVALALLLMLLEPLIAIKCSPWMLCFAAVIVSAWYGVGPGLLAIALAIPTVDYFFISPIHSLVLIDATDSVQMVVFSLVSLLLALKATPNATDSTASEQLSNLRDSEAKFRRLFDANMLGVLFSDLDGNITQANDAFLKIVGYTQEDLKAGKVRWDKMTPPEYRHLDEQAITELKACGVATPWEKEYICSNGDRVSVVLACALLEGSQENCVSFILDLTERQRTEQELRQLYQQVQDLNRSLEYQVTERTAQLHEQMQQLQLRTAELATSQARMQAIVDNVPLGLFTSGNQGCEFVNQHWLSQMGLTLEEALGTGWLQTVHPEDREWVAQEVIAARKASRGFAAEFRFVDRDGNIYWMLERAVPILDETQQVQFYQGFLVDVTERKQAEEELQKARNELEIRVRERTAELAKANLELQTENIERQRAEEAVRQSEELFRSLSACSPVGIFLTDVQGYCIYTNPCCQAICGYTFEQALEEEWAQFVHPDDRERVLADWSAHAQAGIAWSQEYRFQLREGIARWVYARTSPMLSAQGKLLGHVGTIEDITERKQTEEQLLHNAFYDELTGLPNRALFMNRLEQALEYSKRHEEDSFAVLFLDVDRFKVINDSLGHLLGDQFLIAIAGRIEACLRLTDTAARLGGDEFTILLQGIKDVSDALRVAERIQKEIALPFHLGGQEVFTTVSIGIALNAASYDKPEALLRDADTAMYQAKALGKARYEIFNTGMHTQARDH